ncbi:MAG: hypothetical protein WAW06_03500, partial [bacterium]
LARIYRRFFWRTYDNIGPLVVINAIWFGLCPLATFLVFRFLPLEGMAHLVVTALVGVVASSYAGAGIFALAARLARREEIRIGQFFGEARRFFVRTLAVTVIFGVVFLILWHSIRFYAGTSLPGLDGGGAGGAAPGGTAGSGGAAAAGGTAASGGTAARPGHLGVLGYFLAGIQLWILAFCLLMQVYLLPLIFTKDWGVKRAIKWSAMLVVLRPGLTILIFLQVLAIAVLLAITGIGAVALLYSVVALFLTTTLREILRDLDARWTPKTKPTSWKEIFDEAEEDREDNRTLRDILRPWDS